jgi:acyl-CoA reductase-like NAD-dependent aldehyde dehydrogenase
MSSGQRCVSAGRILVAEKIFDQFADRFVATVKRLRIDDPLDSGNFTGPVIHEECEYGMGYENLPCIGAEVQLPFGGVKKSGNGHPSAARLVQAVTHKTAWTINYGTEVKMAQGLTTAIGGGRSKASVGHASPQR